STTKQSAATPPDRQLNPPPGGAPSDAAGNARSPATTSDSTGNYSGLGGGARTGSTAADLSSGVGGTQDTGSGAAPAHPGRTRDVRRVRVGDRPQTPAPAPAHAEAPPRPQMGTAWPGRASASPPPGPITSAIRLDSRWARATMASSSRTRCPTASPRGPACGA